MSFEFLKQIMILKLENIKTRRVRINLEVISTLKPQVVRRTIPLSSSINMRLKAFGFSIEAEARRLMVRLY